MCIVYIQEEDLEVGDVILCYSKDISYKVSKEENYKNDENSGFMYSHAAIYLGNGEIGEATSPGGIKVNPFRSLLDLYDYLAIKRYPQLWGESRVKELRHFIKELANNEKVRFNLRGIKKYIGSGKEGEVNLRDEHIKSASERMERFLAGNLPEIKSKRDSYFCSELIVSAFIYIDVFDQAAAVIFTPEVYSPDDIAKDGIFGDFVGYIKSYNEIEIPKEDLCYEQARALALMLEFGAMKVVKKQN